MAVICAAPAAIVIVIVIVIWFDAVPSAAADKDVARFRRLGLMFQLNGGPAF